MLAEEDDELISLPQVDELIPGVETVAIDIEIGDDVSAISCDEDNQSNAKFKEQDDARLEAIHAKNLKMDPILDSVKLKTKFYAPPDIEEIQRFLDENGQCGFTCKADPSFVAYLKDKFPLGSHYILTRPHRIKGRFNDKRLTDVIIERNCESKIVDTIEKLLDKSAKHGTNNATVKLRLSAEEIHQLCEQFFPETRNFGHSIRPVAPGIYDLRVFDNTVKSYDLPCKKTLEHYFTTAKRVDGKPPAVHLTVKRRQVNLQKCQVYGYNFMICKIQPDDIRFLNILVFQRDQA